MKKCSNCGHQNFDISVVCDKCKSPLRLTSKVFRPSVQQQIPTPTPTMLNTPIVNVPVTRNRRIKEATKNFMVIRTIFDWLGFLAMLITGFVLLVLFDNFQDSLPSFLSLPFMTFVSSSVAVFAIKYIIIMLALLGISIFSTFMSISYSNKIYDDSYVGLGFKICTYVFISPIAGMLMPCDSD